MKINNKRLMSNLFALAEIGKNAVGGIDRWFGSQEDAGAREWILSYWRKAFPDAELWVDAIGNLCVQVKTDDGVAPIMLGSHHDAVPCGGKYDGALGVLMATEVLETLQENQVSLKHPIRVVSFTGEEPNPFNMSTLGSKVLAGRLTEADLEKCFNRENGESMETAIRRVGGDIHKIRKVESGEVAAFLECHIEQGHRLEDRGLSVASVTAITGIYREEIVFQGEANHAGTTIVCDRKDALLACCDFALRMEQEFKPYTDGRLVGTIGHMEMKPNEVNIIPETVRIIIDIRTCRKELLDKVRAEMNRIQHSIEQERRVRLERKVILDQPCTKMDVQVTAAVEEGICEIGEPVMRLESMAGHDAANMAKVTRSGMIFVKSVDGKSHCKEEYTPPEDIEKAGNVMLRAVLRLDQTL